MAVLPNPSNLAKGMIAIKLSEKTTGAEASVKETKRAIGTNTKRMLNLDDRAVILKEVQKSIFGAGVFPPSKGWLSVIMILICRDWQVRKRKKGSLQEKGAVFIVAWSGLFHLLVILVSVTEPDDHFDDGLF